jgi:transglutaminase-like putative cysteine protease
MEARLLSGTHLVVYLSWIVLFQEKELRTYWWMLALSVLQIALGSVLTNETNFGLWLVLYLFWAFWTMSLFSLYLVQKRLAGTPEIGGGALALPPPVAVSGAGMSTQRREGTAAPRMGSLLRGASVARGSIQHEPQEQWISARFATGILIAALLSLMIAAAFFLGIPRYWIGNLTFTADQTEAARRMLTGFTEEVKLGEIGDILESSELVMSVELFDDDSQERLSIEKYAASLGYDEPMFRGLVLEIYANGSWKSGLAQSGDFREEFLPVDQTPPFGNMVRQHYTLNPTGSSVLFSIPPVHAVKIPRYETSAYAHPGTSVLLRSKEVSDKRAIAYDAYSPRPSPNSSLSIPEGDLALRGRRLAAEVPDGLDRLGALAREVAGLDAPGEPPTRLEIAQRLVSYLRDSGEFQYSLDATIQDPDIDPVEDFLFNRKTGHCEYFASALALMLRAAGVPSRLVNGFKGGDFNTSNGLYQVQQRHAHAWVEAMIDRKWLVFDATPAARAASVQSLAPPESSWQDLVQIVKDSWFKFVHMDLSYQQALLYRPLRNIAVKSWQSARRASRNASEMLSGAVEFLASPRRWISWQGLGAALAASVVLAGLVWLSIRSRAKWAARWKSYWSRRRNPRNIVDFYERFRKLCKARGLERRSWQTQQEFGGIVGQTLDRVLQPAGLADFPDRLVDSFYAVRFGSRALEADDARDIEQHLDLLEAALSNGNGRQRNGTPQGKVIQRPAG